LAKIAADLDEALALRRDTGACGDVMPRTLASGASWSVADVLCTHGPHDAPFEEQHSQVLIALVAAGNFEYRSRAGADLLTPGAAMLGNMGECFECGHRHGTGDRCIAFRFTPECIERIAADAGMRGGDVAFGVGRIAPSQALAPFVAAASAGVTRRADLAWDELALTLAARVLREAAQLPARGACALASPTLDRVMQVVRLIDEAPDGDLGVEGLARRAGLSPYHFLRTFERATGTTPHQYVLRARLRAAAQRLADEPAKIVDVALDCGFGDVSNFNRAFRIEFGVSPRIYRARMSG
jgi:AraC family transcriptional regulator